MKIDLGFFTPLALIFITLKLIGIINWNWLWVLLPLFPMVLIGCAILGSLLIIFIFDRKKIDIRLTYNKKRKQNVKKN